LVAYFIQQAFIFIHVPDEGLMEKPKHVARFGKYNKLNADTALLASASVYLSKQLHAAQSFLKN
jgi:hypothetical protein